MVSLLCYAQKVAKKKGLAPTTTLQVHHLKGRRKGAILKEQVWSADGEVVAYDLAYINLKLFTRGNGRILGYDNSHGYHHRHFMGKAEPVKFSTYAELVERFIREVHELWRLEDEET
ncbi:MAG TPA: DUF6516 family protein [Acidobacteriaceae bacterium]|nr:DUF6516 family protein [Acidobacteriaceae bacterium]